MIEAGEAGVEVQATEQSMIPKTVVEVGNVGVRFVRTVRRRWPDRFHRAPRSGRSGCRPRSGGSAARPAPSGPSTISFSGLTWTVKQHSRNFIGAYAADALAELGDTSEWVRRESALDEPLAQSRGERPAFAIPEADETVTKLNEYLKDLKAEALEPSGAISCANASMAFRATPVWNSTSPISTKNGIGVSEKEVTDCTLLRASCASPSKGLWTTTNS